MLQSSTGRRPIRSESRPQIGDEDELHDRVDRPRQRRHEVARAESAREAGQERDDEPEAEQVEEDGEEQRPQRGVAEPFSGPAPARRRSWRVTLGQGRARLIARRAPPPDAGRAVLGAAREVVLPVDDAHGAGCGGSGSRKKRRTAAGIFAHSLEERGARRRARGAGRRVRGTTAGTSRRGWWGATKSGARRGSPGLWRGRAASRAHPPRRRAPIGPGGERLELGLDPLARDRGEQVVRVHEAQRLGRGRQRFGHRQQASGLAVEGVGPSASDARATAPHRRAQPDDARRARRHLGDGGRVDAERARARPQRPRRELGHPRAGARDVARRPARRR